jgi:pimeloyl-ACP methyl ester carboxylesterase
VSRAPEDEETGRPSTPASSCPSTGAADLRIRPRRIATAVVIGLVIALFIDVGRSGGSPSVWLARHGWRAPYAAEGRLVDIGGRSLYLDCRGSGSPTVIFEAGAGGDADGWGVVFPETAAMTRACVYNRAGLHRSDPAPAGERSAAPIADDLAALLMAAGERPPYVLVAHSLGGVYARVFAARPPGDVAGIVLDDAFNPDLFEAQVAAAPERVRTDWLADMDATFRQVEAIEGIDWQRTAAELAAAGLGDLPIEAVTAPRRSQRLTDDEMAIVEAARLAAMHRLSSAVRVTVADGSGHFIHIDRPDLIMAAIRRAVDVSRQDRPAGVASGGRGTG